MASNIKKTKGTEPCPYCGAKPNAGKIIIHKKDCSIPDPAKPAENNEKICCNEPMRRQDGPHYAMVCPHNRLLTVQCDKCRVDHNGVLRWRCNVCGRVTVDAPGRLQGHEARRLSNIAR